ncbi:hypothetical protein SESBI_35251 [Sesbania bispinosa]|nr:hypothetical protein SESBI_35251 [Sesbania bispinosa]
MACSKLIRLTFQKFNTRKFHGTAERSSNWRDLMKKELSLECENHGICIYRVPSNMHQVEPKAYRPNNISMGPFHYGAPHLRKMEMLKRKFYCRLFNPNGAKLEEAFKFLEDEEVSARRCYMDEIKLSSDEFLQMMLIDGSFIIQLLRDLSESEYEFGHQVPYLSRWMLPIMRRELIMLENQLPLSVDSNNIPDQCDKADELKGHHFLDLLVSSMRPKLLEGEKPRGVQHHMIRSVTELKEAGVKIKTDENRQLLDISFGKKWGVAMRELTIPPLYINDHRGTVFRNIVAFEKCHKECDPDVTTYLFFFNGLINSADDVALLNYNGVLHHSLGDDDAVSKLINKISEEMVRDRDESYLHRVVNDANEYFASFYARKRGPLVHYYLTSWVVGISTIGAFLALYFTFIQTVCGFADALKALKSTNSGSLFLDAFCTPFRGTPKTDENGKAEVAATKGRHDSNCGDLCREVRDLCMQICLTE